MWGQIRPQCPQIFRQTWLVVGQSHLSESSLDQSSCCYSLGCYFVSKAETLVNWTLFGKRLANIASERRKVFGKLLFAIAVSLFQISSKDLYQELGNIEKGGFSTVWVDRAIFGSINVVLKFSSVKAKCMLLLRSKQTKQKTSMFTQGRIQALILWVLSVKVWTFLETHKI